MKFGTRTIIPVFLLVCILSTGLAIHPIDAFSEDWLDGWSYRKPIFITGATGAGTNYQLNITVTYNAHMKAAFDDLRFTSADGTTLLDAWAQTISASSYAFVWVEVKDSLETDTIIYMYYGNAGASSNWYGERTFLLYDGFDGVSLNSTKWATSGTGTATEEYGYLSITSTATQFNVYSKITFSYATAVVFMWASVSDVGQANEYENFGYVNYTAVDYMYVSDYGSSNAQMTTYNTGNEQTGFTGLTTQAHYEIRWLASNSAKYYRHGVLIASHSTQVTATPKYVFMNTDGSAEGADDWLSIDAVFVRKCIVSPPVIDFFGGEEEEGISWKSVNELPIYFVVPISAATLWALNGWYIVLGAGMVVFSTCFAAYKIKNREGGKDDILLFLVLFIFGWCLIIGSVI